MRYMRPHYPSATRTLAVRVVHISFLLTYSIHPDNGASHDKSPALVAIVYHRRLDIADGAGVKRLNHRNQFAFRIPGANRETEMVKLLAARGADVGSWN